MTVTPSSPLNLLEPYIAARLRSLESWRAEDKAAHSDFDLNPGGQPDSRSLASAAVLVGLISREGGISVLLTRRADTLRRHSGQVAFPGGRADAGETPAQTALRESWEEVGLDRRFVRPLGLGDAYVTGTGFSITPVVGLIRPGFELTPFDAEVAEIFELPFAFLMDAANHQLRSMTASDGVERRFYAMELGARTVWGATAGMIRGLQRRLFG
jgi:8-oxo-dGTP pyrophosphatase MutT (NUDIX family)